MQATSDVCYVNEQGELICGNSSVTPRFTSARSAINTALGKVSDARLDLIMGLIEEVMQSPIDDDCIATRSSDTIQSVHDVLQVAPPVMLLFRYVSLPGNIMAAYYVQQNNFKAARGALDQWSKLKPGC